MPLASPVLRLDPFAAEYEAAILVSESELSYLASCRAPIVGFVKRLVRSYLGDQKAGILRALAVGERTPIFLIQDRRAPRYSCYVRLATGRPAQSALTGVVRLETVAALPLEAVRSLADGACRLLPCLASDAAHDPRAPQNLHPIGGLEARLRRRLGDPLLVRRALEASLHREALAS